LFTIFEACCSIDIYNYLVNGDSHANSKLNNGTYISL
jgi:hypothetical protein